MNRSRILSFAAFLVPTILIGQQSPGALPPVTPNATTAAFKFFAAYYGNWLVTAFDSIPSSKYSYRPTPIQQSVGYIAQHVENANYGLCDRFGPMKHATSVMDALADTIKATWPKDTLVARLRRSLAFCDSALAQLTDAKLDERVPFGPAGAGMTALPARSALGFVTDLAEHYSQIANYMRLLGLIPPSALPPKPLATVDVPVAVLSRYVGKYDLPASAFQDSPAFVLDVSLNDAALYLRAGNRPAVRLWPETPTDFFVKEAGAEVSFTKDASGAVTALVLRQNGEDRIAPRRK